MKPFSLPKQLQSLTDEQLAELNDWLDDPAVTYKEIRQRLLDTRAIKTCNATLFRYNQRRGLADRVINHQDSAKNIRLFLAIQNGEPIPYDQAGLALVQERAFEAACAPKITASTLATLQRVFHYKTARAEVARREARADLRLAHAQKRLLQTDRRNDIAERALNLREQLAANPQSKRSLTPKQEDQFGPLARNWNDVSERVRIGLGISKEEAAHRAALRKAWKEKYLLPSDQQAQNCAAQAPINTGLQVGDPASSRFSGFSESSSNPVNPDNPAQTNHADPSGADAITAPAIHHCLSDTDTQDLSNQPSPSASSAERNPNLSKSNQLINL